MATTISRLYNNSNTPVAYVGKGEGPTGWASWAFPAETECDFGWTVETHEKSQALLTKSGVFYIWDDGEWNIKYQEAGQKEEFVLVKVNSSLHINIQITVEESGKPSAKQL